MPTIMPPATITEDNTSVRLTAGSISGAYEIPRTKGQFRLRVSNRGQDPVHYRWGTDDTVVALAYSGPVHPPVGGPPGIGDPCVEVGVEELKPPHGTTHVAFIMDSGTAAIRFQPVAY